ncbi:MAG: hypothetical protein PF513_00335 [Tenericutes bacterium]|jgi:hypothetical protein|nr:hypothetical protein [Mycoplasmatota bacterium]
MNNKDIKNRIKEKALSEMPDILHKIDLNSIDIEPEQVKSNVGLHINFKLAFTSFLLIITGFLAFQLFNISDSTYPLDSDAELLGFETVSAQALLDYSIIEETDLGIELNMNPQSEANDTEEYLNEMTPMIELAELIVNDKDSISYEESDSNIEGYQKKILFRAQNLSGDAIEYNIYYNQVNGNMSGKIVNGDYEYEFTKDNQNLKLYKNETDFIEVSNTKAETAHEFTYRYVINQTEQFSANIKMAIQDNNYQAEFNYENNKGIKISLMMRRQNPSTMDVDYDIEDQTKKMNGRFNVDVQDDQVTGKEMYHFMFNDSSTAQEEKPGRPHHSQPGNSPDQDPPGNNPNPDPPGHNY